MNIIERRLLGQSLFEGCPTAAEPWSSGAPRGNKNIKKLWLLMSARMRHCLGYLRLCSGGMK